VIAAPAAVLGADPYPSWLDYPILPHVGELVFGFLVFGVLYFVVRAKVVPALEQIYAERTAAIEGGIARAEAVQVEAARVLEEYQAELSEARAERARIIQQASEEAAVVAAEIRQRAQDEANRITTAATQQIQAAHQQAVVQLRAEVGALATELASRIIGESLQDEARQSRVVDRFLTDLEAAGSASGPVS